MSGASMLLVVLSPRELTDSCFFQMPPLPVIPPVAPLTTIDSHPTALSDLPAASGPAVPPPSQYFSPTMILPSLPLNAATPLPMSPAMPLQAVKLPHTVGAPLAVPCRTLVPNVAAATTAIPLLAVAPQGAAALPIHPAVAQLPGQPVYQATFPQMVPSDIPPSPLHTAQTVRATPLQPTTPMLSQPHQPTIAHLPEQTASAPRVGSQVIHLLGRPVLQALGRPLSIKRCEDLWACAPQHLDWRARVEGGSGEQIVLSCWLGFSPLLGCLLPPPTPSTCQEPKVPPRSLPKG